jgi:signal transduction histidine kinase
MNDTSLGDSFPRNHDDVDTTKVLLVEDNVGFAYGVRDALVRQSAERFEVMEARTLADALEILQREEVDVVLLDLGLPDSSRLSTFSRTYACASDTAIIILTVLNDDGVAMQAVRAGAQDYLVKSEVEGNLLVRSIRYAIERNSVGKSLRELSGRLLQVQEAERRRIARDLHEMPAQDLAALSMNLATLQELAVDMPQEARHLISECMASVSDCSKQLRTMSYLLRPPLLDELGLAVAVRDYADGFARRSGIRVDLELPRELPRLDRDTAITLFRVMQESLTNVHMHSGSATASVRFECVDDEVRLEVSDAGRWCLPHDRVATDGVEGLGVGIAGMQERLRQLRGHLDIEGTEQGTTVRARTPLLEARDE